MLFLWLAVLLSWQKKLYSCVLRGGFCSRTSLSLDSSWVLRLSFSEASPHPWVSRSVHLINNCPVWSYHCWLAPGNMGGVWEILNDFDNLDSAIRNPVAIAAELIYLKLSSCLDCYEISVYLLKCYSVNFGFPSTEVLQRLERCFICNLKYSNVFSMYQIEVQELPVPTQVPKQYYCLKWLISIMA